MSLLGTQPAVQWTYPQDLSSLGDRGWEDDAHNGKYRGGKFSEASSGRPR